jgi:hypothetical protein
MASDFGTLSMTQRNPSQTMVWKMLAKKIATTLRCGLPGIITAFDPATQYCTVQLVMGERVLQPDASLELTSIPALQDVLLMLPGDANWCLTFPSVVGSECYVLFADMCINDWSTNGMQQDSSGKLVPCKQELVRRHDLSDGFAVLAPRSQPKRIANYSTTNVELRSMDGNTKIALTNSGTVLLKGTGLEIDGTEGNVVPGTTTSTMCIPITLNGVIYYVRLSTTP